MGMPNGIGRNCTTGDGPKGNPDPARWELMDSYKADKGFVLKVRYFDCTNFEGLKIMVLAGDYDAWMGRARLLDPHFSGIGGPLARFVPTELGWKWAVKFAEAL